MSERFTLVWAELSALDPLDALDRCLSFFEQPEESRT
jgi:hypothetical protein